MSRANDADALKKDLTRFYDNEVTAKQLIDEQPTIEPRCETCEAFNKTRLLVQQPERKKGKWLFKERREPVYDLSGVKTWGIAYMCSECGFIHTVIEDFGQYAYCPNSSCGAEMEGQDDRK